MTISVDLDTVASSIAALNISGITVKGIDAIPDSARLLCPLLIPNPTRWLSDISTTRATTGGAGSALMDMSYTLNYIYLHCEAQSGMANFSAYAGCINNLILIFEAILANDNISGAVDMTINGIERVDNITDPAGNEYLGVMFSLRITEFVQ